MQSRILVLTVKVDTALGGGSIADAIEVSLILRLFTVDMSLVSI